MLKLITLSFLAFTLAACASSEVSGPSDANNNGASLLPKPMLPAHALPGERNGAGKGDQFDDFRLANTDIYGITAAPQTPLRAVAQWDDHQALLLTWTGSFPDVMANIVQASKNQIDIYVVHEGNFAKQQFQSALQDNGVSSAGLNYFNMDTDSIWMRDYGPLSVRAPDGTVAFVDPRYYHQRVFDDALPTKIGNEFGINIYRQPLQWEGGTYIADGKGNCIYSQGVYQFGGTSQEKIHTYQKDYLGCTTNIVIKPLAQEGTTHSDMFAKMYAPNKVLLGDYQSWQDSGNAQILDDNEAILESAVSATGTALEVTRLPMPSNSGRTVWRTYANSLFVNGTNLVPIYSDDTQFQAAAMGVWQSIMPSWNHVMIDSTELITWSGAIHCITMTVPSGSLSKVEADPPFLCAGDFDCFPSSTGVGSCAFEGCCDGSTLNTCNASGATTQACGGQGCGWSDATMSYQCGGSGGGPIAAAPLSCGATCTPSCTGSACGSDGCGGSCGACASGETCVSGQCEAPDDPCGGISFQGCCEGNTLKYCDNGQAQSVSCNDGCGWQSGQGWYNCGFTGTDPTGANPKACASECTPDCSGKTCGDDGCGGSCGSCSGGQTCTGGQCECVADCSGKLCGGDGCGGSCGTCAGGSSCSTSGQCVDDCAPDCSGKACGTDGCGGTCGTCDAGATCTATGQCQAAQGCGDLTFDGKCEGNTLIWCQDETINDFECSELGAFECKAEPGTTPPNHDCLPVEGGCTAECTGKVCGSDGCGGVCGNCGDGESCVDGACEGGTTDPCNGLTWEGCCADGTLNYCGGGQPQTVNCGNNGCGWNADQGYYDCNFSEDGPAEFPKACGATACEPSCAGNVCGSDGCGGSCGTCTGGLSCEAGQCMDACQSIPFEGACEGTTLSFCEGGAVESGDCAQFGGCCGWNGAQNYFDCLEGDACTGCVDACAAGDGGCNEGATHAWTCQSAADGCLAPAYVTCVDGCDAATGQCSDDGPPPCTASCDNKQCGDDGCGASCGACLAGESCNASGQCVSGCNPSCDGKSCGSDGCGGSCGLCGQGESCVDFQCIDSACQPDCDGKQCGDNGCGGSCGGCDADKVCDKDGQCIAAPVCVPVCDGTVCGPDGCGGSCGICGKEQTCEDGQCIDKPNAGCDGVPTTGICAGDTLKVCSAGTVVETDCAANGQACGTVAGQGFGCVQADVCLPSCIGRQCGPNGCGGSCGSCSKDDTCTPDGQCVSDTCTPQCQGAVCGSDGCGGICGTCPTGQACNVGSCEEATTCADGSLPVDGKCPDGTDGGDTSTGADSVDAASGSEDSGCSVSAGQSDRSPSTGSAAMVLLLLLMTMVLRRFSVGAQE